MKVKISKAMLYRETTRSLLMNAAQKIIETLKIHQLFSVHTALEQFKNAPITGHFRFVFEEDSGREIT